MNDIQKIILIVVIFLGFCFTMFAFMGWFSIIIDMKHLNEPNGLQNYENSKRAFDLLKGLAELIFMSLGFVLFMVLVLKNKKE